MTKKHLFYWSDCCTFTIIKRNQSQLTTFHAFELLHNKYVIHLGIDVTAWLPPREFVKKNL